MTKKHYSIFAIATIVIVSLIFVLLYTLVWRSEDGKCDEKLCHYSTAVGESYKSFVRKRVLVKYQSQSEVFKVML